MKDVQNSLSANIKRHEPFSNINCCEDLEKFNLIESEEEGENDVFSIVNPDLIDFEITENSNDPTIPLAAKRVQNILLLNEQYYELCSQFNAGQKHMFCFIMRYSYECVVSEINNKYAPHPFYLFLRD